MSEPTPKTADCRECYEKQIRELAALCKLDDAVLEQMRVIKDEVLADAGDERIRPDRMGELIARVTPLLGTDDPYRDIKRAYNQLMLDREQDCAERILAADEPFQLALRYAVAGNLIDFGGKTAFTRDDVTALIDRVPEISFSVDDSMALLDAVRRARSIMYLGDNCGEIVLDKLVIREILRENPDVQVTYGVRGGPVINDVTVEDAAQVGMGAVARVLSSGVATPTTVPSASSEEFQRAFFEADLIISKGMGNFEMLVDGCGREDVYFLLMTKCAHVARLVDAPLRSFVCKRGCEPA